MACQLPGLDLEPLYVSANILYQSINDFLRCIVKSPVQMSGAGVRLILRSLSGSVQLKKLRLKSLTTYNYLITTTTTTSTTTTTMGKTRFMRKTFS